MGAVSAATNDTTVTAQTAELSKSQHLIPYLVFLLHGSSPLTQHLVALVFA